MAAPKTRYHPSAPHELERYLVPTEGIVFMLRRHWLVLFEPVGSVILGVVLILWLDSVMSGGGLRIRDIVILVWLVLLARMVWKIVDWHMELFICTDRRLILLHGIVTRKVDMMPMAKVTDMRYDRSLMGMILGYGVYVLESAGQDQALTKVNFIPEPDLHYQQISQVIFAPPSRRLSDKLVPSSTGSKLPINEPESSWWRR